MPESAVPSTAGFFGKLPSRGDFIGRHLPKSFLDPWDTWLQEALMQSRVQLAGLWRDYYCTSPIWRFVLGPGLCSPTVYAGILMPSVDRVGRYYPLVIAIPLPAEWPLFLMPLTGKIWFEQAEQLALAGLELNRLDIDDFSRQIAGLGTPTTPIQPHSGPVNQAWYCPAPAIEDLAWMAPTLSSHLLDWRFPPISLWWTEGSERISPCLLVCNGLPPVSSFAGLLSGEWQQSGWTEKKLASIIRCSEAPTTTEESSI
jgi:type VI secretion system protein ImpM